MVAQEVDGVRRELRMAERRGQLCAPKLVRLALHDASETRPPAPPLPPLSPLHHQGCAQVHFEQAQLDKTQLCRLRQSSA